MNLTIIPRRNTLAGESQEFEAEFRASISFFFFEEGGDPNVNWPLISSSYESSAVSMVALASTFLKPLRLDGVREPVGVMAEGVGY